MTNPEIVSMTKEEYEARIERGVEGARQRALLIAKAELSKLQNLVESLEAGDELNQEGVYNAQELASEIAWYISNQKMRRDYRIYIEAVEKGED